MSPLTFVISIAYHGRFKICYDNNMLSFNIQFKRINFDASKKNQYSFCRSKRKVQMLLEKAKTINHFEVFFNFSKSPSLHTKNSNLKTAI